MVGGRGDTAALATSRGAKLCGCSCIRQTFAYFISFPFPSLILYTLSRAPPPFFLFLLSSSMRSRLINGNISYRFLDTGDQVLNFEMGSSNLPIYIYIYLYLVAWSSRVLSSSSPWNEFRPFPSVASFPSLLPCTQIPERTSMIEILS